MITAIEQELSLHDELHTAVRLIKMGLKEVRNIDGGNDFYHPLMLTLASGIERLMKVIICFHILETTGTFPSSYPWEVKEVSGSGLHILQNNSHFDIVFKILIFKNIIL